MLKTVKRCVCEHGKATLVEAPHADILWEAIEEHQNGTTARAAMCLVKVKAHRGRPADESADIKADKTISSKDVPMEWHARQDKSSSLHMARVLSEKRYGEL